MDLFLNRAWTVADGKGEVPQISKAESLLLNRLICT
jgi:hypothetical protein